MFILFALQLTLSIWIFVQNDKFLTKMGELVDSAWNQNDAAQGYPMDALQISVSCKRNSHFTYFSYRIESNLIISRSRSRYSSRAAARITTRITSPAAYPHPAAATRIAHVAATRPSTQSARVASRSSTISGPPTRI